MTDAPVPTRSPTRRPDLPGLTSLRAFAAFAVLLYHLNRWTIVDVLPFGLGYVGVTFFFVLSGFILTWSRVPGQRARTFYSRRFARVYPTHLFYWTLVVLVPVSAVPVEPGPAVANLLLVQAWSTSTVYSANGVAWSLACEAFFYALFPLLLPALARLRLGAAAAVAVAAWVVAGTGTVIAVAAGGSPDLLTAFFTDPLVRLPEFLVGIVAARFIIEGGRARVVWLGPAALVAVLGLLWVKDKPAADVWLGPLVVVVILLATRLDLAGTRTFLSSRLLVAAGRVSFAFYLTHELVIVAVRRTLGQGVGAAVVAVLVAAGLAVLVHRFVEVPANRRLVRLLVRSGSIRRVSATRRSGPTEGAGGGPAARRGLGRGGGRPTR